MKSLIAIIAVAFACSFISCKENKTTNCAESEDSVVVDSSVVDSVVVDSVNK